MAAQTAQRSGLQLARWKATKKDAQWKMGTDHMREVSTTTERRKETQKSESMMAAQTAQRSGLQLARWKATKKDAQ